MLNPEIAVNQRPVDRLSRNPQLAAWAERVQPVIAKLVASAGTTMTDLLHGTIIGHPLHAIVTDIPVGAWTVTAVLDTLELVGGPVIPGADAALGIGLAGAAAAAVSGLADWSDTSDDPRTLGLAHALLNTVALGAYLGALYYRRTGHRRTGLILALAGYGVVGGSAYLGGELAYGMQIGIKHTAEPIDPSDAFAPVFPAADLHIDVSKPANYQGIPILLTRSAAGVTAISAVCTHRGAPLADGIFADGCVRCPWHGSIFALADGAILAGPATFPQPRFEARENGDQIEVRAIPV